MSKLADRCLIYSSGRLDVVVGGYPVEVAAPEVVEADCALVPSVLR